MGGERIERDKNGKKWREEREVREMGRRQRQNKREAGTENDRKRIEWRIRTAKKCQGKSGG